MAMPLALLIEYLDAQIAEADRSANAYLAQAAQCRELRRGLETSLAALRSAGGDAALEAFLVERIAQAGAAELANTEAARPYEAEAARHRAARARLTDIVARAP